MKKTIQNFTMTMVTLVALVLIMPAKVVAQDAVKVDPKHYSVEFENGEIRVLRIKYGPGEKSVIHYHPRSFAIFITDYEVAFTDTDGKVMNVSGKAGTTMWDEATQHLPKNIGKKPMEVILVEFKTKVKKKKNKY